ncbi:ParB N-terminal domain-containing protein [Mycobacterium marinum]|uniref:ParB N-terminal domain-containing protein n=1 Tax=Mycobacterium marinum TaxID=1781 RepID=UPI0021C3E772|nr:ParB N-terminal domain-containing protein [Mycobacterium marinum]
MPELSAEQLDALRSDIAANGVLIPVVKDQHGRIIDGHNRAAIATELGIDYPVQAVQVIDDDDAYDRALALNCGRRHLSREQVRDLITSEIRRKPDDSDRAIARRIGCSPTTVGTARAGVRREAEELTERIRVGVDQLGGQIAAAAFLSHKQGAPWQTLGDTSERIMRGELSKLDTEIAKPEVWGPLLGQLFDEIRSYDCTPDCKVCTPFDRQWRDEHPGRVYRWSQPPAVSNLDTEAGCPA